MPYILQINGALRFSLGKLQGTMLNGLNAGAKIVFIVILYCKIYIQTVENLEAVACPEKATLRAIFFIYKF